MESRSSIATRTSVRISDCYSGRLQPAHQLPRFNLTLKSLLVYLPSSDYRPVMNLQAIIHDVSTALNDEFHDELCIWGQFNTIYILVGKSGTKRSLRVHIDDLTARLAKQGNAILHHLKQIQRSLPAPNILYEASTFTVLSYVEGHALGSWFTNTLSQARRFQLLDGLVSFIFNLWTCTTSLYSSF